MIPRSALPFPRDARLHPLSQDGLVLRDEADIRQPLLHDDGDGIGRLLRIDRLAHHLERDAIPALGLLEREVPLQLEVQRVELPDFCELVLLRDLARHVQLPGLRVEVDGSDPDQERRVHAVRGSAAGGGFGGHAPEGGGAEEVGGPDEIVGVPLGGVSIRCRRVTVRG